jgi:hypothetical protein
MTGGRRRSAITRATGFYERQGASAAANLQHRSQKLGVVILLSSQIVNRLRPCAQPCSSLPCKALLPLPQPTSRQAAGVPLWLFEGLKHQTNGAVWNDFSHRLLRSQIVPWPWVMDSSDGPPPASSLIEFRGRNSKRSKAPMSTHAPAAT